MTLITEPPSSVREDQRGHVQAILAAARVEGLRMVRHPAFLAGTVVSVLQVTVGSGAEDWAGQSHYLTVTGWMFAWVGMLVAAALVAGRERFLSDPDLFPGTPVTPADRVLGTALGLDRKSVV